MENATKKKQFCIEINLNCLLCKGIINKEFSLKDIYIHLLNFL